MLPSPKSDRSGVGGKAWRTACDQDGVVRRGDILGPAPKGQAISPIGEALGSCGASCKSSRVARTNGFMHGLTSCGSANTIESVEGTH